MPEASKIPRPLDDEIIHLSITSIDEGKQITQVLGPFTEQTSETQMVYTALDMLCKGNEVAIKKLNDLFAVHEHPYYTELVQVLRGADLLFGFESYKESNKAIAKVINKSQNNVSVIYAVELNVQRVGGLTKQRFHKFKSEQEARRFLEECVRKDSRFVQDDGRDRAPKFGEAAKCERVVYNAWLKNKFVRVGVIRKIIVTSTMREEVFNSAVEIAPMIGKPVDLALVRTWNVVCNDGESSEATACP